MQAARSEHIVFGAELLERKPAKAASVLAQAEPFFDERGYSGGNTQSEAALRQSR